MPPPSYVLPNHPPGYCAKPLLAPRILLASVRPIAARTRHHSLSIISHACRLSITSVSPSHLMLCLARPRLRHRLLTLCPPALGQPARQSMMPEWQHGVHTRDTNCCLLTPVTANKTQMEQRRVISPVPQVRSVQRSWSPSKPLVV